ncbi:hypothetical protein ACFLRN_04455 [Thermoproteota archaeon]
MADWSCMKCGHKWCNESKEEPRQCPMCRCGIIYVPRVTKKK